MEEISIAYLFFSHPDCILSFDLELEVLYGSVVLFHVHGMRVCDLKPHEGWVILLLMIPNQFFYPP